MNSSSKVEENGAEKKGEDQTPKVKKSEWYWPEMIHWRDIGWFIIYYPGFFILIIFCFIFIFFNPDPVVWFGKVDFNARLFETE